MWRGIYAGAKCGVSVARSRVRRVRWISAFVRGRVWIESRKKLVCGVGRSRITLACVAKNSTGQKIAQGKKNREKKDKSPRKAGNKAKNRGKTKKTS